MYARPVIPLLICLLAGIFFGYAFPHYHVWAFSLAFIAFMVVIIRFIKNKNSGLSPIILFLALGYLSIQPWVAPKFSDHHIIHFADSQARKTVGRVASSPIKLKNRIRFILETQALIENKTAFPVNGNITVSVWGRDPGIAAGDRIAFVGKIKPVRNFNNPGRFDYKRYMHFRKIWGIAHASAKKLTIEKKHSGKSDGGIINTARMRISGLIDRTSEGEQKGVLKALIIGDRQSISPAVRNAFNRAGVGHLLAISGLHIGIVATVAFIFFRWLLSRHRGILWRAWTRKGAAVLSFFPVLMYGLLAGMSPSTQRAVIMVSVFLLSFLIEREPDPLNTLAVAALLILVWHPPSLFSISFQLSFTAVVAIIYGLSKTSHLNSQKKGRYNLLNKFISFMWVSFFAILGTLPLVMLYFNQVSLVGLAANLICIPLIGFIVVPLGLVAVFVFPLTATGALWLLNASAFVLSQALKFIAFFAEWFFAAFKTVTPSYIEIACFYIGFWLLLNLKQHSPKTPAGQESLLKPVDVQRHSDPTITAPGEDAQTAPPEKFSGKSSLRFWKKFNFKLNPAGILAVVIITLIAADVTYWSYYRLWHKDLRITAIDVGQGTASLVEIPNGFNILIDGGGFSDNSSFDVGARIIAPLLWQKKIKTVDTLILSHPNSDHLNGLLYIAKHFKVKQVWTNSQGAKTESYNNFKAIIAQSKISLPDFKDLPRRHHINGVGLKVLYPPVDFLNRSKKEKWRNTNNNSLVIKVEMGKIAFLFPGDISTRAEKELVRLNGPALKSTVLFAPHHGSRHSSSDLFLESVDPDMVIISAGWKNRFKFPHPLILNKYRQRGSRIYRTDLNGAITLTTDGNDLTSRLFMDPSEIQTF